MSQSLNSHVSLDEVIRNYPSLHRLPDGTPRFLGISGAAFKHIFELLHEGTQTAETGAGFSSLAFILKGTNHTAICPDTYLEKNIRDWCDLHRVDHSRFTYYCAKSQDVLPELDGELDLAFVDGDHAFPIPMIDYYYLARRLKPGGHMIIDDTQIWTGEVISKHLALDRNWEFIHEYDEKTSIFRLNAPFEDKGFGAQPFVLANSRRLSPSMQAALRR
ncbi:MAG: class I SAM-dependent methyltransferase [Alphaproteobacteria bacterium]|nr:class I SAM-dependent methyltransferase [Alphaproteobacteria bacterium]